MIYPGDHVDVILTVEIREGQAPQTGTFTTTILENVRVIAVDRQVEGAAGSQGQPKKNSRSDTSTVTLEVLPSDAERLVLATAKGQISLAMRSLADSQQRDNHTPIAFKDLLAPPPVANGLEEAASPEPAPRGRAAPNRRWCGYGSIGAPRTRKCS